MKQAIGFYIGLEGSKVVLRALPKVKNPTKRLYGSVRSNKDAVKAIRDFKKQEAGLEYWCETHFNAR